MILPKIDLAVVVPIEPPLPSGGSAPKLPWSIPRSPGGRLLLLVLATCAAFAGQAAPSAHAAAGGFESLSSFGVGSGPRGVAVEASTGDVFVEDAGGKVVEKLSAAGTKVGEITGEEAPSPGFEEEPLGVAVDNSSGAYKGDVYVAVSHEEVETAFVVDRFKPKAGKPDEYEYECQFTGPTRGCFKDPATEAPSGPLFSEGQGVAVDSEGNVYITSRTGVYEFEATGASVAPSAGAPLHEFLLHTVDVAVSGNDVYVSTPGASGLELVKLVIDPTTHAVEEEAVLDTEEAHGVTVDPAGNVYVVNEEGSEKSHVAEYASTATAGTRPVEEFGAGEIGESRGLAYSSEGNGKLYVAETANNAIHVFEREGASVAAGSFESLSSFSAGTGPHGVAEEASTGDVFVADVEGKVVEKLNPAGTKIAEITAAGAPSPGFEEAPFGVAVDNSGDAYKGDVYVAVSDEGEGEFAVDRFKPKGLSGDEPNEYEYECQFTGPTRGCFRDPGTEAPLGPSFEEGQDVAVDSDGDVYVTSRDGVYEFEADGASVAPSAGAPLHEFTHFTADVAVSGNDVYVSTPSGGLSGFELVKLVIDPATHAVAEEAVLDTEEAQGVTVDSAGNVYVVNEEAEGKSHVAVYASTATAGSRPVEEFGAGEIGKSRGLAYSSEGEGKLYVAETAHNALHVFEKKRGAGSKPEITACTATIKTPVAELLSCMLKPNGEALAHFDYREGSARFTETAPRNVMVPEKFEEEVHGLKPATEYAFKLAAKNKAGTEVSGEVAFTTAPAIAGVKPCTAINVLAESATFGGSTLETIGDVEVKWHFEYGLAGEGATDTVEQSSTTFPAAAEASVSELEPNAEYQCRLVAGDTYGTTEGQEGTFETKAVPPFVAGELASFVVAHAATLSARVNPKHSATSVHFEYGETESYGQQTPSEAAGSGLSEGYVNQRIEQLGARTTYHFRVVATNEQGMVAYGPDETFTTGAEGLPVAQTGAASDATQTAASISGTVDPEGIETSYTFEVGTDITYGGAKVFGDAGQGEVAEPIAVALEDLAPGTTYHYRLTATNADGSSYGQDMTFITPGIPSPISQPLTMPLLATPSIAFPTETGTTKTTTKALTRAQKLAAALRTCRTKKKGKRASCERRARKQYAPAKAVARKKKNNQ